MTSREGGDYFSEAPESRVRWDATSNAASRRTRLSSNRVAEAAEPDTPGTPKTPGLARSLSSNFNSPGISFKIDDDVFVLQLDERYLRMGLGGESQPRCKLDFGPSTQAIPGDFSQWMPDFQRPRPQIDNLRDWGQEYELWRPDLRGLDFGLLADRIERAIRTALTDHVLILDETKKRNLILVLPSGVPQPLFSSVLTTIFNNPPTPPTITVLPTPTLSVVAAGLRSGLVVDVGWFETTVTCVYELREVHERRTSRALKRLTWAAAQMVQAYTMGRQSSDLDANSGDRPCQVLLEESEDLIQRMAWCHETAASAEEQKQNPSNQPKCTVPLEIPEAPPSVNVPFSRFSDLTEDILFTPRLPASSKVDDDETPLSMLLFEVLLALPLDIRQICLQRLVVTGDGSSIPGLKSRLLNDLRDIIMKRGFNSVDNWGKGKVPHHRTALSEPVDAVENKDLTNKDIDPHSKTPAHEQPQLPDTIMERMRSRPNSALINNLRRPSYVPQALTSVVGNESTEKAAHHIRSVATLGAWVGGSIVSGLRLKSLVEIDREIFLQRGLAAPHQDDVANKRKSMAFAQQGQRQSLIGSAEGLAKSGDRSSGRWTLGVWA